MKLKEKEPSTAELIERGFAPRDGKIDILFIFPPTTLEGREAYHHRAMIPLGIASLAGYLREKGCGVGVLDCPGLRIQSDEGRPACIANPNGFIANIYLSRAKKIHQSIN